MTNEEKSVGIGLVARDNLIRVGVKRDVAEVISAIAQQSALEMAKWKDKRYENEIRKQMKTMSEECKQKAIAFIQSNYGTKNQEDRTANTQVF